MHNSQYCQRDHEFDNAVKKLKNQLLEFNPETFVKNEIEDEQENMKYLNKIAGRPKKEQSLRPFKSIQLASKLKKMQEQQSKTR